MINIIFYYINRFDTLLGMGAWGKYLPRKFEEQCFRLLQDAFQMCGKIGRRDKSCETFLR